MKWLFAGLLVINLALLGWNWMRPDSSAELAMFPAPPPRSGPGLVLLQELDKPLPLRGKAADAPPASPPIAEPVETVEPEAAAVAVDVTPEPASENPPSSLFTCLRLVGLDSKNEATRAGQALAQGGAMVKRQGEETGETKRYWVMLPPVASPTAAAPILQRLERAGVKDFYLIRTGENANAVSLGVYSAKDSAQRRVQQIRAVKLKPRIEEIALPVKRWWLEFDWPADGSAEVWRGMLPKDLRMVAAENCR
ncbi:SPOR domain-containing protein [Sulfurivermis fontis]|uniref:SPOR domain-containing protein n=1 Tax=Sulfurivermis fontis TaxID=1972068 RepID=UPI000FDCAF0E|nr:SPOR domain-containing protein [Sulfurivermis fontis]